MLSSIDILDRSAATAKVSNFDLEYYYMKIVSCMIFPGILTCTRELSILYKRCLNYEIEVVRLRLMHKERETELLGHFDECVQSSI